MTMRDTALSAKIALSEIRHGWRHFYVFVACLVLGVAIMATVNSIGSVVKRALQDEAQGLLGGHMEIRIRGVQATQEQEEFMSKYGKVSYVATLRSMLHVGESNTLVEVKAIDDAYPLIGELLFNEDITTEDAFKDNGIVVDAILLSQMDVAIGDEVRIGEATYEIRATIKNEPDRVVQIFTFGPRVMMSHSALSQSGLVR
ncbi:MAG: ABC transporter permease, partial [Rickettsiales bacterium]|nr:ABC transporter permease [Rickettsiales bacterium]